MLLRYTAHAAVGVCCLLLMVAYQPVKACTCLAVTDEEQFCTAKNIVKLTVMRVTIVQEGNELYSPFYILHHVRIDKVFKSMKSVATRKKLYLRSEPSRDSCSVHLTVGRQYLVSGSIDGEYLNSDSCDWVKVWASVNPNEMKLLNGVVKPKCA
ncbi:hypothetical protein ACJMK2_013906 [Sinanodonta woodiana]|uniref:NTR domain-containing protein n=1 Tax=Sinanodonta woodiana TaxID=1069815 RepID=A0ABD3UYY0_SINWO